MCAGNTSRWLGMCAGPTTDCLGKNEAERRAADARHGLDARRREWGEESGRSGKIECLPCRQRGRKGRWVAGLLLIRATHLQGKKATAAPAGGRATRAHDDAERNKRGAGSEPGATVACGTEGGDRVHRAGGWGQEEEKVAKRTGSPDRRCARGFSGAATHHRHARAVSRLLEAPAFLLRGPR